jgi:hypothetical protein
MKITREHLIELARDETERRVEMQDILSAYLIGSVARSEPLLGGAADIDLVLIHEQEPLRPREVVQLSDEVHLDIFHHHRGLYEQPRALRVHPWIGPSLCEPVFIHDPDHFFEWAQAGARGQFHRADHVHLRAQAFLRRARQANSMLSLSQRWIKTYARSVLEGANAIASLSGFPVAGRRLFLDLEEATEGLGFPEFSEAFLQLLVLSPPTSVELQNWLPAWERAFEAAGRLSKKAALAPCRRTYFRAGFQALMEIDRPEANMFPLLTTWEMAVRTLQQAGHTDHYLQEWEDMLGTLGLDPSSRTQRDGSLVHYLNQIETRVSDWAETQGV